MNKIIKYRFLYTEPVADTEALKERIVEMIKVYNNMPQASLYGCTPNEVLEGAKPDKHSFTDKIKQARTLRIQANQEVKCKVLCE